jgi:hypothetical protein
MIVNANLSEQRGLGIFRTLLQETDPDFNSRWFQNVGETIMTSLVINMFFPVIELILWGLKASCCRLIDKRCCLK